MSKYERDKGKRGEREVAHLFRQVGYCADRTKQSDGRVEEDVRVRFGEGMAEVPISVEVKWRKAVAALRFHDKAREDARKVAWPVTFLREDRKPQWVAMIDAEFLMYLLESHPTLRPGGPR